MWSSDDNISMCCIFCNNIIDDGNFFVCNVSWHSTVFNGYNFDPNADWLGTLVTHEQYLVTTDPLEISPATQIKGWSLYRNLRDLLHDVYLGLGKDVAGQLLFDFCRFYGDPNLSLRALMELEWAECRQHYRDLKIHCTLRKWSELSISWADANDYPTLENQIKGSECKLILMWAAQKACRIAETLDSSDYSVRRANMASALCSMLAKLDECSLWLTQEDND